MAGRYDPTVRSGYAFYYPATAATWVLNKNANNIASTLATVAITLEVGRTYRATLDMAGTTNRALVDVTEIANVTDTSLTAAGRVVLLGQIAATATTGLHIDNVTATAL